MKNMLTAIALTAVASTAMATTPHHTQSFNDFHEVQPLGINLDTGAIVASSYDCFASGIIPEGRVAQSNQCRNFRNHVTALESDRQEILNDIASFQALAPSFTAQEDVDARATLAALTELVRLQDRYDEVIRLIREWDRLHAAGQTPSYSRYALQQESYRLLQTDIPRARAAHEAARATFDVSTGNWGAYLDNLPTVDTNPAGMFRAAYNGLPVDNTRCDVFGSHAARAQCDAALANVGAPGITGHVQGMYDAAHEIALIERSFYNNEVVPAQAEFATLNAENEAIGPRINAVGEFISALSTAEQMVIMAQVDLTNAMNAVTQAQADLAAFGGRVYLDGLYGIAGGVGSGSHTISNARLYLSTYQNNVAQLTHLVNSRPAGAPVWSRQDWREWNNARRAFMQSTNAHTANIYILLDQQRYNVNTVTTALAAYDAAVAAVPAAQAAVPVARADRDAAVDHEASVVASAPEGITPTIGGASFEYSQLQARATFLDERTRDLRTFLDRSGYGLG